MIYWVLSFNPNIQHLYNVRLLLFYFNERNEEKQLLLILAHIQNLRN